MDWKQLAENLLTTIMDCIEDSVESMYIVVGKKMLTVFFGCLSFLVFSLLLLFFELPAFITWQEALPACLFTGYLAFMDKLNKAAIGGVTKQLKGLTRVKGKIKGGKK